MHFLMILLTLRVFFMCFVYVVACVYVFCICLCVFLRVLYVLLRVVTCSVYVFACFYVFCICGRVPRKDAGRKTMKIGGSGVPRTLTGSRMVTKRIKYVSCICVAQ